MKIAYENYLKDNECTFEEFKDRINYNIEEYLYDIIKPLTCSSSPYDGSLIIGGDPEDLKDDQTLGDYKKDDQTLGDYKKEIIEKLKSIGINIKKLEFIVEAWVDN